MKARRRPVTRSDYHPRPGWLARQLRETGIIFLRFSSARTAAYFFTGRALALVAI